MKSRSINFSIKTVYGQRLPPVRYAIATPYGTIRLLISNVKKPGLERPSRLLTEPYCHMEYSYIIFYRLFEDRLVIARVISGYRDLESLFSDSNLDK